MNNHMSTFRTLRMKMVMKDIELISYVSSKSTAAKDHGKDSVNTSEAQSPSVAADVRWWITLPPPSELINTVLFRATFEDCGCAMANAAEIITIS